MRDDDNWRKGASRHSNDDWRGRTRPLNRTLEAAKMRREPQRALRERIER